MHVQSSIKFTYLAQPYAHLDPEVRNDRAELGALATAWLMQRNWAVHAPIPQGHAVALHLPSVFAHDHKFWMDRDIPILASAQCMHLLPLTGWRVSRGVAQELDCARKSGLPVYLIQHLPGFDHRLEMLGEGEIRAMGWRVEA
jgi:hypothetical protein